MDLRNLDDEKNITISKDEDLIEAMNIDELKTQMNEYLENNIEEVFVQRDMSKNNKNKLENVETPLGKIIIEKSAKKDVTNIEKELSDTFEKGKAAVKTGMEKAKDALRTSFARNRCFKVDR